MATLSRIVTAFAESRYPLRKVPSLPALALYDDENFADYDFDVIGPKPRKFFTKTIRELNFRAKGSREFHSQDLCLRFHRPKGQLGVHPMSDVSEILLNTNDIYILTPTEAVLSLLLCEIDFSEKELYEFVYTHPINFNKIKKWSKSLNSYTRYLAMISELEESQKKGKEHRKKNVLTRLKRGSSTNSGSGFSD